MLEVLFLIDLDVKSYFWVELPSLQVFEKIKLKQSVFGLASAFSPGYVYFLIFRTCAGVGLGATVPTDLSLFMEFCPTKHRGVTMILMNLYWSAGAAFACVVAWAVMPSKVLGDHQWRYLVGIGALPGILIIISRVFVPESPRYDLVANKVDKAYAVLKMISRWNNQPLPKGKLVFKLVQPKTNVPVLDTFVGLFSKELWLTTVLLWIIWFFLSCKCFQFNHGSDGGWGYAFITPLIFGKFIMISNEEKLHRNTGNKSQIYIDAFVIF
jgi:MFS transporter, putative metabolite:H+ symporter